MGVKSIKVPQPEFSNWVIQRRQELGLSPAGLSEKLNGALSERTLKYLEDGKKESFSEYTLTILAQGLELDYADLLHQSEVLQSNDNKHSRLLRNPQLKRMASLLLTAVAAAILTIALVKGLATNKTNRLAADTPRLQDALINTDYPHIIFAHDAKGNTLWQKNLDTPVIKVEVVDLDRNGSREVIAATGKRSYGSWGERPGWLLVWNEAGELLTEQNMWQPSIYPAEESQVSVNDFEVVDLDADEMPEIVVMVRGQEYYPSRLGILHYEASTFKEVNTFWNPGYISILHIEDINADGFPEIICAGANNDLKRVPGFGIDKNVRAVFMLQGRSIFGQAPPYLGEAEKGSQIWYRYLTPPVGHDASDIVALSTSGDREKHILVKLKDGCFFYLNYAGEIVERFYGDHCEGEAEMHFIPNEKRW